MVEANRYHATPAQLLVMKLHSITATLLLALPALAQQAATVGGPVPEFSFGTFLNGDGRQSLADFRGSPILIDFWGIH